MKIHVLYNKAEPEQLAEMLEAHGTYIKMAVDIQQEILAGGGEFHADCEAILLLTGSKQDSIWGAGWIPDTQEIRFEALLNISPRKKNPSMEILDKKIEDKVKAIALKLMAGK